MGMDKNDLIYVLEVIPRSSLPSIQTLTFYAIGQKPKIGELIEVPIQNKTILAIVINTDSLISMKANIKTLLFQLKPISRRYENLILSHNFIAVISTCAQEQCLSKPEILIVALPSKHADIELFDSLNNKIKNNNITAEVICISNPDIYKKYREGLRHKHKAVYFEILSGSSSKLKKELGLLAKTNKRQNVFIVTTVQYLALLPVRVKKITCLGTPDWYRQVQVPHINSLSYIKNYCEVFGIKFKQCDLNYFNHEKIRSLSVQIINRKESGPSVLGPEIVELINKARDKNTPIILIHSRLGYATQTICRDCNHVLECENCASNLVLHMENKIRKYVCHYCKKFYPASKKCPNCDSWNLITLGIGSEQIIEKLKLLGGEYNIREIKKASEIINKKNKFEIILMLENFIPALESEIDYSAVVSIDSLLVIPDYNARERAFQNLWHLKKLTKKVMLVQTRHPKDIIFKSLLENRREIFTDDEMARRKKFGYPPFKNLIKITIEQHPLKATESVEFVKKSLTDYNPIVTPAFIRRVRSKDRYNIFLQIGLASWPDKKLYEKLMLIKKVASVEVNPLSIL